MRFKILTLTILLLSVSAAFAQESLEDYYQDSKNNGTLDMRPEVNINRVSLSQEGQLYADSLEAVFTSAAAIIPEMTKEGFLSNGVGRYLAKQELIKKVDVYEIEEITAYRDSKNYDYSEFYANIDNHLAEARLRASESLFFVINEDCRSKGKQDKFGNLDCWSANVNLYNKKIEILNKIKTLF